MFQLLLDSVKLEDSVKLTKELSERFKRSAYWNKYKVISNKNEAGANDNPKYIRELLDASYQGVKILFVLAFNNTAGYNQVNMNSFKKYFLQRVEIEEIFMINQLIT